VVDPTSTFGLCLGNIPLIDSSETRSISAENPTGAVGGGAMQVPDARSAAANLGKGWKARPCIELEPGSTTTLAEITGPGVIQHLWITADPKAYRDCVLRMYWDDEPTPSVEVPLGDFFACGHALRTKVSSLPIAVNPAGGFNSYWPMPFRKSARITIESQHWDKIPGFFYQITYTLKPVPDEAGYFHVQWRRSLTRREYPEHTLLDGVRGQGHYVGTYLAWTQLSNGWWGEGEVKFYLDDDREHPTICGTGTEDYFGGAWGFYGADNREEAYCTAFSGLPLVRQVANEVPKYGMYRWHILDPIRFRQALRVTIQALGWWPNAKFQPLTDDIASTAYWYQLEPHADFPPLPRAEERWPR
jgi:hypothetical protein